MRDILCKFARIYLYIKQVRKYIRQWLGINVSNKHQKELAQGGGTTFLYRLITMLLNYVIWMVISFYYGPEGVGHYNLLTTLLSILTMLGCLGFSTSVVRFVSQYMVQQKQYMIRALYHSILKICLAVSFLLLLLCVFFAPIIAEKVYHQPSLTASIVLIGIALPFSVLTTIQVEFIRGFKKVSVSEFLRNLSILLINTAFILLLQKFFRQQELPFITYCIAVFFTFLATTYILHRDIQALAYPSQDQQDTFSIYWHLSTSFPMILTAFTQLINGKVSVLLLGYYVTPKELGIFSMAFKITTITNFVLMAIKTIAMPKISELFWSDQKQELKMLLQASNRVIFYFSLVVFLVLFFGASFILELIGNQYLSGLTAFKILAFTQFYNAFCGLVAVFLNMTGHQRYFFWMMMGATLINVILCIYWIPLWGIDGAAWAGLVSTVLWNTVGAIYVYRKYQIETYFNIFKQKK